MLTNADSNITLLHPNIPISLFQSHVTSQTILQKIQKKIA